MEAIGPEVKGGLPKVLQGVTLEYLRPQEGYEVYQWYQDLVQDLKFNGDLTRLYLLPVDKLLKYLDILVEDGHPEIVASLLEYRPIDPSEGLSLAVRDGLLEMVSYFFPQIMPEIDWEFFSQDIGMSGHLSVIQFFLLDEDFDKDQAMYGAGQGGHHRAINYLHDRGADLTKAFNGAAYGGQLETLDYLRPQGNFDLNSALTYAAMGGQLPMVQYLISQGASDLNGALREAASEGHLEVVKDLITRGATDVSWALQESLHTGNAELIDYLRHQPGMDLNQILHRVAAGDYALLEDVRFLVELGATDLNGALVGVSPGHPEITEYLVSQGAAY